MHLKNMIGCCGLDCEHCDAYLATTKLWSELNNAPILPEHINCEGCRGDGTKTVFCENLCEIRRCAMQKGLSSCGCCPDFTDCSTIQAFTEHNPSALENLK